MAPVLLFIWSCKQSRGLYMEALQEGLPIDLAKAALKLLKAMRPLPQAPDEVS